MIIEGCFYSFIGGSNHRWSNYVEYGQNVFKLTILTESTKEFMPESDFVLNDDGTVFINKNKNGLAPDKIGFEIYTKRCYIENNTFSHYFAIESMNDQDAFNLFNSND